MKTNLVGWAAAASINAGAEVKIAPKWTLNMDVSYNPFQYRSNKKLKHILVAPEARWWLCAPYSGHFIGGNLMYSHYNAGGMNVPFVDDLKTIATKAISTAWGLSMATTLFCLRDGASSLRPV